MWVCTIKGIYIINPEAGTIKNISIMQGISDSIFSSIKLDGNGLIWIATGTRGINIIDLKNKKIKYLTKQQGLSNDHITAMCAGNEGQIMITNNNDPNTRLPREEVLDIIDMKVGMIKHLGPAQGVEPVLSIDLIQNNDGNIFIGTNGKGIEIINSQNGMFRHLNTTYGFSADYIGNIIKDSAGAIWAACYSGIAMFGKNGLRIEHFGKSLVGSIVEDNVGRIWMAKTNELEIFDPKTGLVKSLVVIAIWQPPMARSIVLLTVGWILLIPQVKP